MDDIIKIVKSLKDSVFLWKGVSETIQNEAIEKKGRLLSMLLRTLGASLLGNMLEVINEAGRVMIRAGCGSKRSLIKNKDF